jgi:hypothetical protein
VPHRKPKGKLATTRDYAKVDFKPWPKSDPPTAAPSTSRRENPGMTTAMTDDEIEEWTLELIEHHVEPQQGAIMSERVRKCFQAFRVLKQMGVDF